MPAAELPAPAPRAPRVPRPAGSTGRTGQGRRIAAALPGLAEQQAADAAAIGVPWSGWPVGPGDLDGWGTRARSVRDLLLLPWLSACLVAALPMPLGWWADALDAVQLEPLHHPVIGAHGGVGLIGPLIQLAADQTGASGCLPSPLAVRAWYRSAAAEPGSHETRTLRAMGNGPIDAWLAPKHPTWRQLTAQTSPEPSTAWRHRLVDDAYARLPLFSGWVQPPPLSRRQLNVLHVFDRIGIARRCRWRATTLAGPAALARQLQERLFSGLIEHVLLDAAAAEQTVLPAQQAWRASLLRTAGRGDGWHRRPDVIDGSVGRLVLLGATPQRRRSDPDLRRAGARELETMTNFLEGRQWYT